MIEVYRYIPAWNLPCISPFVTKLVNYLAMTGADYELIQQDLTKLQEDAPYGKLPYIVDEDGTKVADSNTIIQYLKDKYGDPLDAGLSTEQKAEEVAWNRLLDEHFYWSSVIQPRWFMDGGWETYIPYIVGGAEVPKDSELRAGLDAFREVIVSEFHGQGMGRRSVDEVWKLAREDLDAISDYLGDKPYFFGDEPRSIDAGLYGHLMHALYVPFESQAKEYGLKKKNLVDYCTRMRDRYGV
jgi:glutathione S-transferase